ncbi:hypothetical protein ST201phi2-1p201 [Pseudomonas phage 201phi2-1]|uniref:Uncharacterized protein n=1 Tax=Pseudomonas phage 201phi2-1 TaxID=198110 RepID=B3FJ63_BP201|nr:hypothetical protein ST201phi2-1p201 [Pseudomonas phage 201phi2-1]ABY63030.1 hypothetical protein 201phi2-1p201 [Pseudomonas phage 201phi2-1]
MSFLANYWKAVERAVSETGMNPGDIVIDITTVSKNTDVPDVVESFVNDVTQPQPEPAQAGNMPQPKTDFEARESLARRSARPSQGIEELEENYDTKATTNKTRVKRDVRVRMDERDSGITVSPNPTKEERRKTRKAENKRLKKLGGGRKVRLIIDEVRLNDRTIWSPPGVDR